MALTVAGNRARDVEISQRNVAQASLAAEPAHHVFGQQFAFAIHIGGPQRIRFQDGCPLRFSIAGSRGGKNQPVMTGFCHALQQRKRSRRVVTEIDVRTLHALAGLN